MRGQHHLRRAGMMSAGTLAVVLTSSASPAPPDAEDADRDCRDANGLVTTATGLVCDTADGLTTVSATSVDDATGGATKEVTGPVENTVDDAAGTVHETARGVTGEGDNGDAPSGASPGPDRNTTSDRGPDGAPGGSGSDGDDDAEEESGDDEDAGSGGDVGAAGSPAGARNGSATGMGTAPHLQPLSPLAAALRAKSETMGSAEEDPQLPEIAPAPDAAPAPAPTPTPRQYVMQAQQDGDDRGEATPALMALFALVAAGLVTGGHVAFTKVRSHRIT